MVLTKSTMLTLGTNAPDFSLPDVVSGKTVSIKDYKDNKALIIMFICAHCPYVVHVQEELRNIGNEYLSKDVGVVAISSNDPNYNYDDRPEGLKKQAESLGFKFPYLFDETQDVAKDYTAACTPDLFLFDNQKKLVYRGQLDDSRPGNNIPVTGKDLRNAIENVLAGNEVSKDQKPSTGCNIKWKEGNEPKH